MSLVTEPNLSVVASLALSSGPGLPDSPVETGEGRSRPENEAALAAAGAALGLDLAGADGSVGPVVHLRTAHYGAYRLVGAGLVARCAGPDSFAGHAGEMALARVLAAAGVPVAVPADRLPTALGLWAGRAVGFWEFVAHVPDVAPSAAQFGALLGDLHAVEVGAFPLEPFKAVTKIERRLAGLAGWAALPGSMVPALAAEVSARAEQVAGSPGPVGVLHGDCQPGNVLVVDPARDPGQGRGLVLLDLDTACFGPQWWDLTLLEGRCRRGDLALDFAGVLAAYEARRGPVDRGVFGALVALRDASTAVWALSEWQRVPSVATAARAVRLLAVVDPALAATLSA